MVRAQLVGLLDGLKAGGLMEGHSWLAEAAAATADEVRRFICLLLRSQSEGTCTCASEVNCHVCIAKWWREAGIYTCLRQAVSLLQADCPFQSPWRCQRVSIACSAKLPFPPLLIGCMPCPTLQLVVALPGISSAPTILLLRSAAHSCTLCPHPQC